MEYVEGSDRVREIFLSQLLLFGELLVSDPPPTARSAAHSWHPPRTTREIGDSDHHYQTNVARAQSCIATFDSCFCLVHYSIYGYQLGASLKSRAVQLP